MITIGKSEVPEYLQRGDLYRAWIESDDPDEMVTVPASVVKSDTTIKNQEDCDRLFNSVRNWGVCDFVSDEMIEIVMHDPRNEVVDFLQKHESHFKFVKALRKVAMSLIQMERSFPEEDPCDIAAEYGIVELVFFLLVHFGLWSDRIVVTATKQGHVSILQLMCEHGHEFCFSDMLDAIIGGSLDCVRYIHSQNSDIFDEMEPTAQNVAAERGHAHILKYLFKLGMMPVSTVFTLAAQYGHENCLQVAYEWNVLGDQTSCELAARRGHLACLKCLFEHRSSWDETTCLFAAHGRHLACLQFAHEHGCPWDVGASNGAASNGHLECLQYLHEQGCPWDTMTCDCAAQSGHLECLRYLHEQGCPWTANTCMYAAQRGHLHCVMYAHEHGCPWTDYTPEMAALNGHLECLQYVHEHGCPIHLPIDIDESNPCCEYVQQQFYTSSSSSSSSDDECTRYE